MIHAYFDAKSTVAGPGLIMQKCNKLYTIYKFQVFFLRFYFDQLKKERRLSLMWGTCLQWCKSEKVCLCVAKLDGVWRWAVFDLNLYLASEDAVTIHHTLACVKGRGLWQFFEEGMGSWITNNSRGPGKSTHTFTHTHWAIFHITWPSCCPSPSFSCSLHVYAWNPVSYVSATSLPLLSRELMTQTALRMMTRLQITVLLIHTNAHSDIHKEKHTHKTHAHTQWLMLKTFPSGTW